MKKIKPKRKKVKLESDIIIDKNPPFASKEVGDLFPEGHPLHEPDEKNLAKKEKMIYLPDEDLPEMPKKKEFPEIEGVDK